MDWESSSVEPVCAEEFSFEATAVCDSAGSDSSEFVDDVTYDCDCPVYNAECSVVASAGYDWSESFDESANEVDDCPDNLISDVDFDDHESRDSFSLALGIFNDRITVNLPESSDDLVPQKSNDVALQEVLDRIDREHDTLEEDESSISAENMADFDASELEDIEMQFSAEVDFTLEQQLNWTDEEKLFQAMFLAENEISEDPISGYGIYHSDSEQIFPTQINGLGPKLSAWHKIRDWMSTCRFEISSYADLISS